MATKAKIALSVPDAVLPGRYFSFRLLQDLRNEPAEFNMPEKIFVVSDIEGNFQTFCKLLFKAGVIDRKLHWKYGDGHLVIVGDCFDRGEQVTECLWLIYSLEERARRKGGYVHFILGNHEIMNMNGDWRYVHPKYADSSKVPSTALYHGNGELWHWLRTKNIVEKIGKILFVHGGISEAILHFKLSVYEINKIARPFYTRAFETFTDPILHIIFSSDKSPFWYRGYYKARFNEELIERILFHFGVETIITGHTVVEKVSLFYQGKIVNVDTNHALGKSEGLLIKDGNYYSVSTEGVRKKIK